jgi:hypothetical protein
MKVNWKMDFKKIIKEPIVAIFLVACMLTAIANAMPRDRSVDAEKTVCSAVENTVCSACECTDIGMQFKLKSIFNNYSSTSLLVPIGLQSAYTQTQSHLQGDVNIDGKISIADLTLWIRTVTVLNALDVNEDNMVDSTDFKILKQLIF